VDNLTILQKVAVWSLPVLFAITVHEVAHGWVAKLFGDRTAMMLGRLSLNPIKHIDPVGTILVPGAMLLFSGGNVVFGWAKPVPVTQQNLKNPKRDMAFVALAGPSSNLLMALFWGAIMKISLLLPESLAMAVKPLLYMGAAGISINLVLMILNLIPIPPLDGSRVVSSFLPDKVSWRYNRLEQYGFLILLALLATGILQNIVGPPLNLIQAMIYRLAGL